MAMQKGTGARGHQSVKSLRDLHAFGASGTELQTNDLLVYLFACTVCTYLQF